ncbi:MAG: proline--tRNA ligase [Dehalococcoidia bacterium]|nr:proline--tRNA ligase [Dehalococcoidia bacterium]
MRLSRLFGRTQREVPADADTISHQLMLRAGLIQQLAAGVYSLLPMALRVEQKIAQIIREEMNAAGGQELLMPVVQPIELWRETGRDTVMGDVLFRLQDRRDRSLCLGPTHEEVITDLVRRNVRSYRDLPLRLYQIQTKFRDEPRSRAGLIRGREFSMKDLYSFDTDEEAMDRSYQAMHRAYQRVFARCGLSTIPVEADSGAIGGKESVEFVMLADSGEDQIVRCPSCGYAANLERAEFVREVVDEPPEPAEEVSTPGVKTIEDLATFLNISESRTLKAVFYGCAQAREDGSGVAEPELVFVAIRGDIPVNETKLSNALKCVDLWLATDGEVQQAGLVAGSASPVGLRDVPVIVDSSVPAAGNLVAGANRQDTHLRNVRYGRDYNADIVADIGSAQVGDRCVRCDGTLSLARGIEVGHLFKLGLVYSEQMGARYLSTEGVEEPIHMACFGIGHSRMIASAIEQSHDSKGIIWPAPIAPYDVHLVGLNLNREPVAAAAESLYTDLLALGHSVLYDDRAESPGVKFNDADLLGAPLRLTVSPRNLKQNAVEFKRRTEDETWLVPLDEIPAAAGSELQAQIDAALAAAAAAGPPLSD